MSIASIEDLLTAEGFDEDVIEIFHINKITISMLPHLDDNEMKELGIVLGDRKHLKSLSRKMEQPQYDLSSQFVGNAWDSDYRYQCDHSDGRHEPHESNHSKTLHISQHASQQSLELSDEELQEQDQGFHITECDHSVGSSVITESSRPSSTSSQHMMREAGGQLHESFTRDNDANSQLPPLSKTTVQNVPDRLAGWENDFKIPLQYSQLTMQAITLGEFNDSARNEIVRSIVERMLNYCRYPTLKQKEVISSKIVHTFKGSKDTLGVGYSSWLKRIENRISHMRRQCNTSSAEGTNGHQPSAKKARIVSNHDVQFSKTSAILDQRGFKRLQSLLTKEWNKSRKDWTNVKLAFQELFHNRRKVIVEDAIGVYEVVDTYPPLRHFEFLILDFTTILNRSDDVQEIVMENWTKWEDKILKYCRTRSTPANAVANKSVVQQLLLKISDTNKSEIILQLIPALLDKRKKGAPTFIIQYHDMDPAEVDKKAEESTIKSPFIIKCRSPQFYVVVENAVYFEVDSFSKSLTALMALYYVFDISYPKQCGNTLIFLEKFIFLISTGPELPPGALSTVTDIENRH